MSWNYRLVRTKDGQLSIREVYYDVDDQPDLMSSEDSLLDLIKEIEHIREAFKKSVLTIDPVTETFNKE